MFISGELEKKNLNLLVESVFLRYSRKIHDTLPGMEVHMYAGGERFGKISGAVFKIFAKALKK